MSYTEIKVGLVIKGEEDENGEYALVNAVAQIEADRVKFFNDDDLLALQLSYEELRGILAIMAAHQEKKGLYIQAKVKNN